MITIICIIITIVSIINRIFLF